MNLFDQTTIRELGLRNRIIVSPMCQYSSDDGFASDWHLVHLGSRAVGGAALVFTEAIAVEDRGRISPQDLGIWKDAHLEKLAQIVRFIEAQGAVAGTQLAHAGRKGSTRRPWDRPSGEVPSQEGGWTTVGPSAEPFAPNYPTPHSLSEVEIAEIVRAFAEGARRSLAAGFKVIEIHSAHGYLAHQFLSPLSNLRTDRYGGSFENRARFLMETVDAVRTVWPERLPLFVRLSATDWVEGGWNIDESIDLAKRLRKHGVDLIDTSSGGNALKAEIPLRPMYQTPFAARIRREAGIATGAVGLITTPQEAQGIVEQGDADYIFLARELLRDPYWPFHAAQALGVDTPWPHQYERAKIAPAARHLSAAAR